MRPGQGGSWVYQRSLFVDNRYRCGGGGAQAVNKWHPRRLNTALESGLASSIEIDSSPIATFVAGAPGSITIAGDVTAIFQAGRSCDIRDAAHAGGNDNYGKARPYIVASAVFAAGVTTITFEADAASYRIGTIVADVLGTSVLTTSTFRCLVSGDYRIEAIANCYGIGWTTLRLANTSGFTYDAYGQVNVSGLTVWSAGMQGLQNTVPGACTWNRTVTLAAGQHYELQHFGADTAASENGLGYVGASAPEAAAHAQVIIWRA